MEMRNFNTGATRSAEGDKYDYEGFISPLVLEAYSEYMHKHRKQADGKLRDSDNWQKGIPIKSYQKSLIRHTMDLWSLFRGHRSLSVRTEYTDSENNSTVLKSLLCSIMFNAMGYLFEILREENGT